MKSTKVKLEIKNLQQYYDGKCALDNISFNVMDGEFLSILGPSGCGKSTILRILIGLLEPTSGTILKDGIDITNAKPSERDMGIVFQNFALFENMTVLENVEYALKIRKGMEKLAREKALRIIDSMHLTEHVNKKPSELSGGQQQRVAIARTMILNPSIILFDEPMSALDVDTRLTLRAEIKRLQAEYGNTMIYITHDQEEAFAMSDRIMVMDVGQVMQLDAPENIIAKPSNEYVQRFVVDNLKIKIDSLVKYLGV